MGIVFLIAIYVVVVGATPILILMSGGDQTTAQNAMFVVGTFGAIGLFAAVVSSLRKG